MTVLPIPGPPRPPSPQPVRRAIARLTAAVKEAAVRAREQADEEAIHDLRVALRRLAAALALWRDRLAARPLRRARRRVRNLRRALGEARELEVHVADLTRRSGVQSFVLRLLLGDLLERMRRDRDQARARVAERLTPRRVRRATRPARRAARRHPDGATPADPSPRLLAVAGAARAALAAATDDDDRALHAARVAVKKWRYALEALELVREAGSTPPPPREAALPPAALRPVQRALGDAHDRATLRDRLIAEAARLRDKGLGTQAAALQPLIAEVESERRRAVEDFRRSAARIGPDR